MHSVSRPRTTRRPAAAARVQHRQPRLVLGVETSRRDGSQRSRRRLLAVFAVDVEQLLDRRLFRIGRAAHRGDRAHAPERIAEPGAPRGGAARAQAREALQPSVAGGDLERFERIDVQLFVDAAREAGTEPGHRLQQLLGIRVAAQPREQRPAAGGEHLGHRGGDAETHVRDRIQPAHAFGFVDRARGARQARDRLRRAAVGADPIGARALRPEQARGFQQALGDLPVLGRDREAGSAAARFGADAGPGLGERHAEASSAFGDVKPPRISRTSASSTCGKSR
jgi:hypothetical protein